MGPSLSCQHTLPCTPGSPGAFSRLQFPFPITCIQQQIYYYTRSSSSLFCALPVAFLINLHRPTSQLPDGNFPHSSVGKEPACNARDPGSIPGSGRSPGEGNGNPPQYSCLENPMGKGAWQAIVRGVTRVGHDLVTKLPQVNFPGGTRGKGPTCQFRRYKRLRFNPCVRKITWRKEIATHPSVLASSCGKRGLSSCCDTLASHCGVCLCC